MSQVRTSEEMELTREALLAMGWKPPEHPETQKEQSLFCNYAIVMNGRRIPDIETYWLTPTGVLASYIDLAHDLNEIEKAEEWLERELGVVHCRRGCHQGESAIERIAIWNVNILKNASVLSISAVAPTECLARLKNWLKVWRWSVGMEASDEPD